MLTKATYSKVIGLLNMKITYQIKYKKHPAKTKRFLTTHFKHFISKAITKIFLAFSVEVFQSFQKLCTILGSLVQESGHEIHACAVCVKQAVPRAIVNVFVDKICLLVSPSIVIKAEDAIEEARKAGKGQEEDS